MNMHSERTAIVKLPLVRERIRLAVICPIDRGKAQSNRGGQEPPRRLASCPCVFLDARGPQLLVRAPRVSILSVSAAETK
ncbi:hypothetical protein PBY51_017208 [Eleginops maclovinus]|uniref:Uncharacterized protein n=1 Tax=Eleginops maclovinus TaxID=56733 RepID=A0AAN7XGN1_ELEMC|nr:hypothetical protein PBY51_017208 [Eleginops maclovinus]